MRQRLAALLILALPFGIASASAQIDVISRGPDNGTSTHVSGIDVLPLPGLPFTGTDTIIWTRPLADGSSTVTYETAKVIRDGQGRLYRERHSFSPSADANPEFTLRETLIEDPVAQTRIVCSTAVHACIITNYRAVMAPSLQPVGSFDHGKRYLNRDNLGSQIIDGLSVIGTLETTTIAPGTLGNSQPLKSTREFWYSSDLETNITVLRKDPREGTQNIHLTVLSRSEPAPEVFAIPPGYNVRDLRQQGVAAK